MERLNSKELLTIFARLRGIQESDIKEAVQTEIDRLDLNKYADKPCGSYRLELFLFILSYVHIFLVSSC